MDSKLKTKADARRRLTNSADGVGSVVEFLLTQPQDVDTMATIEVLQQSDRILRRVQQNTCLKEDI